MITELLKFEFTYQRKLWALPVAVILFFLTGFQIGGQAFATGLVNYNAPYQISYYTSLFTLGAVFAIMFFVINGLLRDSTYRMQEIIFSTGVKKYHFFISRFSGVFLFSLLAVSPLLLGMISGTLIVDLDPERLAPISPTLYFWNWLIFVLPNVFICSAFIFTVGLLSKNRMSIYASAVLIYVLYFVCSFYFNSPILADSTPTHTENMMLAALADPFGISAFMEQSKYLTPLQKNSVWVSLTGNLLLNRLLWITISFSFLGFAYRLFSFRALNQKKQKASDETKTDEEITKNIVYQPISPSRFGQRAFWHSFLAQTKIGISQLLKSLPFQAMLVFITFIICSEFYSTLVEGGSYSESLYPITSILAGLNNTAIFIFGLLLIVFYSGEWVWKERCEDFYLILDATPASNASFFWSKASVLLSIPFLFITLEIGIAIAFQFMLDYAHIDIGTYLSLYYYQGIPLVFYILLTLFIQTLSPGKYLGMAISGIVIAVFGTNLSGYLGIEHPLLRIGYMPSITFSDMSGVSNNASAFHLISSNWIIAGLILAILALHVWQRGITGNFWEHAKQLLRGWTSRKLVPLSIFTLLFLCTSGVIFYKTNVEAEYLSSDSVLDRRAEYEKKYKHYEEEPWLYPISISTDVALFPFERTYSVDAVYTLANKSDTAVNRALFIEKKPITHIALERATLINQDSTHGIFEFEFNSPVLPGDSVKLTFSANGAHTGLRSGRDLVDNGSYVHLRDFSPYLGYTDNREITDKAERKKRGLPEREEEQPSAADFELMESGFGRVDFEATLSVPDTQTGISVGNLEEKWTENGRNYFRYKSAYPVAPMVTYHSAVYETEKEHYQGIRLEHYYHPDQDFNHQSIMNSMKQALDYAQAEFGDYPLDYLRVAEIPSYWNFGGFAASGTISLVEDRIYLLDQRRSDAFNLVAKVTIHEVAHQWWGYQLTPKNISGSGLFVEGFAKYTEAVVMEKHYGMPSLYQLSATANNTYFSGRSYASTPEQPLYLEQGEGYMLYGKSYMVMIALKELIGEKVLNRVLKKLVDRHKNEIDLTVTSVEFLDELYKVTPEKYHYLIDDWFKKIITYDLSIAEVSYSKQPDGVYEVTVNIDAKKFESVDGIESEISMSEPIPIGLFSTHPSEALLDDIIYLNPKTIVDGKQKLTFQTDKLPKYVSIDPYGTRTDLVRSDNHLEVD
jgi:hypothetical protein